MCRSISTGGVAVRTRIFGLQTAAHEFNRRPCSHRHAEYLRRYQYKFCPYCRVELKWVQDCPTCGKRFTSEKSFIFHTKLHVKKPECPACKSKNVRRETPSFDYRNGKKVFVFFQQTVQGRYFHCLDCNCVWDWRTAKRQFLPMSQGSAA